MSLKAFHVFFVAIAILMCVSLGVWGVRTEAADSSLSPFLLGIVGFVGAVTLGVYGFWMLKKLKRFSYV